MASVTITSVTLAGQQGVRVSGTGDPDNSNVAVTVQITGGNTGHGSAVVNNGSWTCIAMMRAQSGDTGTATADLTAPDGSKASNSFNFTL
jgi:hypothetical protein